MHWDGGDRMIPIDAISKLILQIFDNGKIADFNQISSSDEAEQFESDIELFNNILIAHKKRFRECYTDDGHDSEISCYLHDCRFVFEDDAISDELLKSIFLLAVCENYKSIAFREICTALSVQIRDCRIHQIRYLLYQRVLNYIVGFRLYTKEPFVDILREFTVRLEEIKSEYGVIPQQLFLE